MLVCVVEKYVNQVERCVFVRSLLHLSEHHLQETCEKIGARVMLGLKLGRTFKFVLHFEVIVRVISTVGTSLQDCTLYKLL